MKSNLNRYKDWHFSGLFIGFVVFLHLLAVLGWEHLVFTFYQKWIFAPIRIIYDYTLGWSPIPLLYVLLVAIGFMIYKKFRKKKVDKEIRTWSHWSLAVVNKLFILLSLFYILWGFNYYRPALLDNPEDEFPELDSTTLVQEFIQVSEEMMQVRKLLNTNNGYDSLCPKTVVMEDSLRKLQMRVLDMLMIDHAGRVRVRLLKPKGALLLFSTAGIYIPYAFEGHIDGGLHPLQWPFTMAHEMAHGYGITNEGGCNFIGLLTCLKSQQSYIKYPGLLSYWRYLYGEVSYRFPDVAASEHETLISEVKNDILQIQENSDRYPRYFDFIQAYFYDYYLKAHGMEDGLESYNSVINLMIQWRKMEAERIKH